MEQNVFISRRVFIGGLLLILFNLLFLNGVYVFEKFGKQDTKANEPVVEETVLDSASAAQAKSINYCPQQCLSEIKEATSSLAPASAKTTVSTTTTTSSSQAKDYYISLGTGTGKSTDWEDISGAQVYVDRSSFGRIKKVVFEASVRVPSGSEDVYVRLYNATDKHPVWNSDLFFPSGTTSNFLISQDIQLDEGNKLYKVQMKTQLAAPANLDQARIHITTE